MFGLSNTGQVQGLSLQGPGQGKELYNTHAVSRTSRRTDGASCDVD